MRIAVTAPTGQVGSKVVALLLRRGVGDLVLLARRPERLDWARDAGARIVQGDLTDGDYVCRATTGADALFWVNPPNLAVTDDRRYERLLADNACRAVRDNRIRHTVLLSSIGAHLEHGTGIISALHDVEMALGRVGGHLTILRPGYFMENYLASVDTIRREGAIYLPVSASARVPMIATRDIAPPAVEALRAAAPPVRHVVTLHGPQDYSFGEAADTIGRTIGRDVRHIRIMPEQALQQLIDAGASANMADRLVAMYAAIERGSLVSEHPRSLQTATPTALDQFARDTIAPAVLAPAR